mmetsp:Transcript_21579/g.74042  ORF Transcript_21579/g.74042 Transcript_21579/m.74042 type:complete len:200 (+) Transcript_21579:894-1493(+)
MPSSTCAPGSSSADLSPTSRACSSSMPVPPWRSRPRGSWCTTRRGSRRPASLLSLRPRWRSSRPQRSLRWCPRRPSIGWAASASQRSSWPRSITGTPRSAPSTRARATSSCKRSARAFARSTTPSEDSLGGSLAGVLPRVSRGAWKRLLRRECVRRSAMRSELILRFAGLPSEGLPFVCRGLGLFCFAGLSFRGLALCL